MAIGDRAVRYTCKKRKVDCRNNPAQTLPAPKVQIEPLAMDLSSDAVVHKCETE